MASNGFVNCLARALHFEYLEQFEELKNAYAPFDPDADTLHLNKLSFMERQHHLDVAV